MTEDEIKVQIEKLVKDFGDDITNFKENIKTLARYMNNIHEMAADRGLFYTTRQDLVSRRYEVMSMSNRYNRSFIPAKRQAIDNYKYGKKLHTPGTPIKPVNEFERDLYLNDDLPGYSNLLKIIDNHINFINDSIKTVDNMIFGIASAIILEKDFKLPVK